MQKPETENQTLPPGVPPMEGQVLLLGRDYKVERALRYLKKYEHNR